MLGHLGEKMAEPLRMSLGYAVHMGEGKRPAQEEVWDGKGFGPGSKKRILLNCFCMHVHIMSSSSYKNFHK
jgi:hypothetical protein